MQVKLDWNPNIRDKKARLDRAQRFLDQRVLADSNYFCPFLEGFLLRSGHVEGPGLIEWNSVYAKKQYHMFPKKTKTTNPNASTKWFERAKAVKMNVWEKLANDKYSE